MLALLCGGQGLLSAQMFDLVADQPEAAAVFAATAAHLGQDPRVFVRSADGVSLLANRNSQILSVCAALTVHACIAQVLPTEVAVAGYSVGEMAAWAIAGVWNTETTLKLTYQRAHAMDAAGGRGGRLGYVRGLSRPAIESLAQRHGCDIAIINPGRLFVVGGEQTAVEALCREAAASGAAKADLLDVRVASHTPRLAAAVQPFRKSLEEPPAADPSPGFHLISGGDGSSILRPAAAIPKLADQIARPLDWASGLEALGELGVSRILDLGPGHALADMAHAALADARSYSAAAFHSIDGLRDWVASR